MILNAYAILSGFVVLLSGITALLLTGLAAHLLWVQRRDEQSPNLRTRSEDRFYLLSLLATWLLGLNLASWPLLYLLLQSYVPQWPGVMCIYGVTQIGAGSLGVSRFLPGLIAATQWLKPSVVFLSGVWLVLYRIHRGVQTGTLLRRVLLADLALGTVVLADAVIEGAYLVIPKREEFLFTGCCTSGNPTRTSMGGTIAAFGESDLTWLPTVFYVVHACLVAGLWLFRARCRRHESATGIGLVLLGAIVAVPITAAYFVEVAAPTVLRLPFHHCLYDLIPRAPDMVVALVLYLGGCACVGWASVVRRLANAPETKRVALPVLDGLLTASLSCYGGALVMTFLDVHLA